MRVVVRSCGRERYATEAAEERPAASSATGLSAARSAVQRLAAAQERPCEWEGGRDFHVQNRPSLSRAESIWQVCVSATFMSRTAVASRITASGVKCLTWCQGRPSIRCKIRCKSGVNHVRYPARTRRERIAGVQCAQFRPPGQVSGVHLICDLPPPAEFCRGVALTLSLARRPEATSTCGFTADLTWCLHLNYGERRGAHQ
jgi:hypothetical protein